MRRHHTFLTAIELRIFYTYIYITEENGLWWIRRAAGWGVGRNLPPFPSPAPSHCSGMGRRQWDRVRWETQWHIFSWSRCLVVFLIALFGGGGRSTHLYNPLFNPLTILNLPTLLHYPFVFPCISFYLPSLPPSFLPPFMHLSPPPFLSAWSFHVKNFTQLQWKLW